MQSIRFILVDVFTDRAFAGNQLAVFTDARLLPDALMQTLAREVNFSESVFLFPPKQGGAARIRIFTPSREVPFAGHPTLGAAFVIGASVGMDDLYLETNAGIVPVRVSRSGAKVTFGWMEQPLPKRDAFGETEQRELLAAIGVEKSEMPIEVYDNGIRHVYVRLASREQVASVKPDLARLERLPALGFNVFAGNGLEYKTRMFAPAAGVSEDPATGSAAGPLAVHLLRHGQLKAGDEIEIEQGTEIGRPSTLSARVQGTPEQIERVEVGGSAVIVGRGEFRL